MTGDSKQNRFSWTPQPDAAALLRSLLSHFLENCPAAMSLERDLLSKTGTRLADWVDSIVVPSQHKVGPVAIRDACIASQFELIDVSSDANETVFTHSAGIFPAVKVSCTKPTQACWQLTVRVEDVSQFLLANQSMHCKIEGSVFSQLRRAQIACSKNTNGTFELFVAQRIGITSADALQIDVIKEPGTSVQNSLLGHAESMRLRERFFENKTAGFLTAQRLIQQAITDIGVHQTCDLFFAAERAYWQSRNHAARIQKMRQDVLGMGWANHDHHTYRCSREHFAELITTLELLEFECRERFYAGEEAGWGAQVLEQPVCGIVIFADVDLKAGEIDHDFAHQGLSGEDKLGTVGLWCALHGEAFLEAGMHHLECQFDFDAARSQLMELGVATMEPFTDFEILRQAFTEPEVWPVRAERIEAVLHRGCISQQQADLFTRNGAVGSHLEILERNEGYKGFNQTGVSQIIKKTDPRQMIEE